MFSKIKNKKLILLSVSVVLLAGSLFFSYFAKAETSAECLGFEEDSDERKKCEELAEKAQKYREIIDIKQRQQESLNNQIGIMDANIGQYETEIELNKNKIDELNSKITRKEAEIKEKEENIVFQKIVLSDLLRSVYDYQSKGVFTNFVLNDKFETFLSEEDVVVQTGKKIGDILENLKAVKVKLGEEKKLLELDKEKLTKAHLELKNESENLEVVKSKKETLLNQTQGEEARYQKMLEKVEAQKNELFNFSAFGDYEISSNDKPSKDNYLSMSWYYSQRDPRWGDMKIGFTSDKMKDYGCAISSVAMVYTYYGNNTTPKDVLKKSDFDGSLIYWPSGWRDTGYGYTNYKSKLDGILKNDNIAILHLTRRSGGGGHFIVVGGKDKNDYIVHDPYFGSNIYLRASLKALNAYVDRIIYK